MSNPIVAFLVWFILGAIVVAAILIYIEIKIKKKVEIQTAPQKEKTPLEKLSLFLNSDTSPLKKIDLIGKMAKNYFKEKYQLPTSMDYGELQEEFKKQEEEEEEVFCKNMFESYYSNKHLTEKKIREMEKLLIKIYDKGNIHSTIDNMPSFADGIDGILEEIKTNIRKGGGKIIDRDIKSQHKINPRVNYKILRKVKQFIKKTHLTTRRSNLHRKKQVIISPLYLHSNNTVRTRNDKLPQNKNGIAQRIIKREKERLEKEILEAEI